MAVERRRPFGSVAPWEQGLGDIQTEVNRLFDSFFGRPGGTGGGRERVWAPALDMHETKDDLIVSVDLPGVREKDVHLSITGDVLTVRGDRALAGEIKDGSFHRLERAYGRFERHIPLPLPVQTDKIRATFRDGVLEVSLPKAEEIKPREIRIDLA